MDTVQDAMDRLKQRIEQERVASAEIEKTVADAARDARWSTLCPDDRAFCTGTSRLNIPCPREATRTCPFVDSRREVSARSYLRSCGFGQAYAAPNLSQLLGRHVETTPQLEAVITDLCAYMGDLRSRVIANEGMMLLGPAGTGKTFALALVAKAAQGTNLDVRFVFAPTLFDLMYERSDMVHVYETCDLLLMDDFGVQYTADWVISRFQSFVERRWAAERPVCVTSNLTADRLADLHGYERFVSRMKQWCGERIWATGKSDLRSVIAQEVR